MTLLKHQKGSEPPEVRAHPIPAPLPQLRKAGLQSSSNPGDAEKGVMAQPVDGEPGEGLQLPSLLAVPQETWQNGPSAAEHPL